MKEILEPSRRERKRFPPTSVAPRGTNSKRESVCGALLTDPGASAPHGQRHSSGCQSMVPRITLSSAIGKASRSAVSSDFPSSLVQPMYTESW